MIPLAPWSSRLLAAFLSSWSLLASGAAHAEARRVLVKAYNPCSALPVVSGLGTPEDLVPNSSQYPSASAVGDLATYCVYELNPGTTPEQADQALLPHLSAFDSAPEILPLELHRQSISRPAPSAQHADAAHAEFLAQAEAWDAPASPTPVPVAIVVVDDSSRDEALAECGQTQGTPCALWPELVAAKRGFVSHGVAMAAIARDLACPLSGGSCSVTVEPELALDTDITTGWARGNQYGDVVSLVRALLRVAQRYSTTTTPVVINLSVGLDGAHLKAEADYVLETAIGLVQHAGFAMVMAEGNAHHAAGSAATGPLYPAALVQRTFAAPSHPIRAATDGTVVPVAGVNRSFSPLAMSQLATSPDAYLLEGHFLAPAIDATPLPNAPGPRSYTGSSVAAAVMSGIFAAGWNLFSTDTGAQFRTRLVAINPMLIPGPVGSRFSVPYHGDLPVTTAARTMEILYPAVVPSWPFGYAHPSSSYAHLSPREVARDALMTSGPAKGGTVPWVPLAPLPIPLERQAILRGQPDPITCDICSLMQNGAIVDLAAQHASLEPVEIILDTDTGEETFGLDSTSSGPYLVQPSGQQVYSARAVVTDPSTGTSMSVELDVDN
ncbi:MAG: S8/S53 family peptidase [Myxococcota bacterium]